MNSGRGLFTSGIDLLTSCGQDLLLVIGWFRQIVHDTLERFYRSFNRASRTFNLLSQENDVLIAVLCRDCVRRFSLPEAYQLIASRHNQTLISPWRFVRSAQCLQG